MINEIGTPQGGNLSPLLSNVMFNELDKELVRRGLNWVRYADDCVIAVRSRASANRVMHTIKKWIEQKLGLKVNAEKTHVCRPNKLKYLGFGYYKSPQMQKWMTRPHESSVEKFQRTLKKLCKRSWSISMDDRITKLKQVIRGSYCGNRYEWVVRRTCVVRAISKVILMRRGLVSVLDYYEIRHSLKTN